MSAMTDIRMKNPAHPGGFVKHEIIEPYGLSVTDAAAVLGVTRPALSALLNERAALSPEMALRIDAARLLTYRAAVVKDSGARHSYESATAKLMASTTSVFCAEEAVQIFGGNGYSKEYPVEKLMRDAKICDIYEGTNEVQRMVISAAVMG